MTSAENYSGRPPSNGIYEWSPSLEKTGRIITYWKLRLSLLWTPSGVSPKLMRIRRALKITDEGGTDKQYVKEQLSLEWNALTHVQRQAKIRESPIWKILRGTMHLEEIRQKTMK